MSKLPETITAMFVDVWDFYQSSKHPFEISRIVTEIKYAMFNDGNSLDLSIFESLRNMRLTKFPKQITYPTHKLKRVTIDLRLWEEEQFEPLFGDWYKRLDVVVGSAQRFNSIRSQPHSSNVHFF